MAKRKLMTINDLYNFCLKNNFCHFSSSDNNEEIYVQLPATFESEKNFDKDKEGLTPFVAKAYHDHINLNKSEIKPEVLESTLPSAMLRPILASIVIDEETGEKDFGSHDFVIEEDEDGNEIVRYIEQPVGVIFGENTIEYDDTDEVNRAVLHGFLFDGYCQDAIDIMNRRKSVSCSVELSIREMSFNAADKVLTLDDFYVSGLTLLGESVKPGMKGSNLTIADFSEKNNSLFSQNNNKLIEMLEQLNTKIDNLSNFTIQGNAQSKLEEGGNETVKLNELLEKYGKTVEDITFEYENMSDEELEKKFEEVFGEDDTDGEGTDPEPTSDGDDEGEKEPEDNNADGDDFDDADGVETNADTDNDNDDNSDSADGEEPKDEPEEAETVTVVEEVTVKPEKYSITMSDGSTKEFALTLDEINNALWALVNQTYGDSDDAYYSVQVYEDNTLIMIDWWNNKAFRQSYSREEDNFSLVGDRIAVNQVWVTEEEEKALNEMKANYSSISDELAKYQKAELDAQKEEIISEEAYAEFAETDEFKEINKNIENYSLDELKTACELAFAKCVKATGNFSLNVKDEKPAKKVNKIGINANFEVSDDSEPYGDYFKSIRQD